MRRPGCNIPQSVQSSFFSSNPSLPFPIQTCEGRILCLPNPDSVAAAVVRMRMEISATPSRTHVRKLPSGVAQSCPVHRPIALFASAALMYLQPSPVCHATRLPARSVQCARLEGIDHPATPPTTHQPTKKKDDACAKRCRDLSDSPSPLLLPGFSCAGIVVPEPSWPVLACPVSSRPVPSRLFSLHSTAEASHGAEV